MKVCDYGMSKQLYTQKYNYQQEQREGKPAPVKWMAPEALTQGKFTSKSDVVCNCVKTYSVYFVKCEINFIYQWNSITHTMIYHLYRVK